MFSHKRSRALRNNSNDNDNDGNDNHNNNNNNSFIEVSMYLVFTIGATTTKK